MHEDRSVAGTAVVSEGSSPRSRARRVTWPGTCGSVPTGNGAGSGRLEGSVQDVDLLADSYHPFVLPAPSGHLAPAVGSLAGAAGAAAVPVAGDPPRQKGDALRAAHVVGHRLRQPAYSVDQLRCDPARLPACGVLNHLLPSVFLRQRQEFEAEPVVGDRRDARRVTGHEKLGSGGVLQGVVDRVVRDQPRPYSAASFSARSSLTV